MVAQGLSGFYVPVSGKVVEGDNHAGGDLGHKHFANALGPYITYAGRHWRPNARRRHHQETENHSPPV